MYKSIDNVIFEFSYSTKLGEIDKKKTFILGKALHEMFVACNLRKSPFFKYDKTPLKSTSNGLKMENFKNNSISHFLHNQQVQAGLKTVWNLIIAFAETHFLKLLVLILFL